MFTVHVWMLIIQQLTICNLHFLLSVDKTKENNLHNKLLNEHKMMLNLYSTISLSNILNQTYNATPKWLDFCTICGVGQSV